MKRHKSLSGMGPMILRAVLAMELLAACVPIAGTAANNTCSPLSSGEVDPQFRPEIDAVIRLMVPQTNGQILVTGDFSHVNGLRRKNLARLNPNGSIDTSFAPVINGEIDTIVVQPDNRIVISGGFTEVNNLPKRFMARLNADGSLDPSLTVSVDWFSPGWGRPSVNQMAVQPDGKLLAAGNFKAINGVPKPGLTRLNPDGSLDAGFNVTEITNGISIVTVLPGGKMLVGGAFSFGGTKYLGLARLNANGSFDPSFQAATTSSYGTIYEIILLPDGKFFTGGPFISIDGVTHHGVARILPDGGLDPSFDPGNEITTDVVFQLGPLSADGKIFVHNYFDPPAIRLLNANGTLDTNFVTSMNFGVSVVVALNDGSLMAGGGFTSAGDIPQKYLARVLAAPAPPREVIEFVNSSQSFSENAGHGELIVRRSGCTTNAVSVDYSGLSGTATPGVDFNFTAGTLHWNANDASDKMITFQIVDDTLVEDAETFDVVLANAVGGSLGARTTMEVTIADNELPASQRDPTYLNPVATFTGGYPAVNRMAIGPDGKVLVQGAFAAIGGAIKPGFARLNVDGSVDMQFNPQIMGFVGPFAIQPDGSSIIGGGFTSINGVNRTNLARLNPDGSVDLSFSSIPLPALRAGVIGIQPDGRILVATGDGAWNQDSGYVLRLNEDGTRDTTFQRFNLPDPAYVNGLVLQPDGKILLAGALTVVGSDTAPGVIRINSDGLADSTFHVQFNGLFHYVTSVALQSDGKILVAGQDVNLEAILIVRLNPDGSPDPTFRAEYFHGEYVLIESIRVQPDGKVILGGRFSSIGASPRFNVARLNTDGSTDHSFDAGNLAGPDTFGHVYAVDLQPDGRILIGGSLGTLDGQRSAGVIRLLPSNATMNIIEFSSDAFSGQENGGQVSVVVVREGNSAASVSVNLNVLGGTATPGEDYLVPPTVVTFAPLEVSKGVVVPILDNNFLEPSKTILLSLTNPSLGVLGPRATTTVIIRDDEIPPSNLDTNFDLYPMFRALQADDKILASFGIGLMRTMPDGTMDQTFPFVFASHINTVVSQPDGKILIGGNFSTVTQGTNLVARSGLARLNTNGTLDMSFNPDVDVAGVCGMALQPDGKILLAGVSSPVSTGFTRLLPNGQLDRSFEVYAPLGLSDAPAGAVAVQTDGKILIGANFYLVNGVQRSGLARLNIDGSLDPNFAPTVTGGSFTSAGVNAIQPLPDGRIWVGGVFTLVNGVAMSGITRLNPNGSLDASFAPAGGVNGPVTTLLAQPDGRIIIAGEFGTVGATDRAKLARLNTDGSLDVGFAPALPGATSILTLGRQSDGAILMGGSFCQPPPPDCDGCEDEYDCTGTLRLKPDAVLRLLRPEIAAGGVVRVSTEVVPGRRYVLQSSEDLTHWASIATNWPAATPWNYSSTLSAVSAKFYRALETR